ncbi:hypothetical protein O3P69_006772 [Scylla paramamosain]|uniref:Uncharacterized protein n=1 Tax=Scylla paramamosain TaxID=85552 RepID=A0AAW0U5L4_SCYPA
MSRGAGEITRCVSRQRRRKRKKRKRKRKRCEGAIFSPCEGVSARVQSALQEERENSKRHQEGRCTSLPRPYLLSSRGQECAGGSEKVV